MHRVDTFRVLKLSDGVIVVLQAASAGKQGDAGDRALQHQGSAADSGAGRGAPSGAMLHWSKDAVDALSPLLRRVESIKVR